MRGATSFGNAPHLMKTLVRTFALILSTSCLQADDAPGIDDDLPQPLNLNFAETLVTQSPFTRSVNLEESLQLTSVAYVDGRPVATVLNKTTKERILVFEEPNALGWKLTGASAGVDVSNTEIQMMVGPEVVTMHYNDRQTDPGSKIKSSSTSRLAGSGNKGSDKFRASNFLGENGRELYSSLSPEARDKFKDLLKSHLEKRPELTPEQSSAYAQKVFAKIKEGDHPPAGAKSPKVEKPAKKKQGA